MGLPRLVVGLGFAEYTHLDLTYRHHSLDSTFYCTVMMLDILKHDKIGGGSFHQRPPTPNSGDSSPLIPS